MNSRSVISSLPPVVGNRVLIEKDQNVSDIISLVLYMHEMNKSRYDRIAQRFWTGDVYTTCEAIFDFCKDNIPYDAETVADQTVKSPQRVLIDATKGRGHDCKHYAGFIGGILDSLKRSGKKINWCYRFASYDNLKSEPGHVFVVVKDSEGEIWIDPVLDYFDEKREPTFYTDRKPISGIGAIVHYNRTGIMNGVAIGGDNKAAADIQVIGGTVCAVAGSVAAVVPVGTVVGAVIAVVGLAVKVVAMLFQDRFNYSTQVRWLLQTYQYEVLGQANVTSDNKVDESLINECWMWFSVCLGVPIWDNLRMHALRGTSAKNDADLKQTRDQKIAAYRAFSPLEAAVPIETVGNAVDIATTFDDRFGPGSWKNYYPANIVLTNGLSVDAASSAAAALLPGSTEAQIQAAKQKGNAPGVSYISPPSLLDNLLQPSNIPLLVGVGIGAYLLID